MLILQMLLDSHVNNSLLLLLCGLQQKLSDQTKLKVAFTNMGGNHSRVLELSSGRTHTQAPDVGVLEISAAAYRGPLRLI